MGAKNIALIVFFDRHIAAIVEKSHPERSEQDTWIRACFAVVLVEKNDVVFGSDRVLDNNSQNANLLAVHRYSMTGVF